MVNHFDGLGFAGRDDGRVEYGALTRSESLMFTSDVLDAAYADGGTSRRPTYLGGAAALPAGAPANFGASLGYQRRLTAPYRDGWYADTTKQQYDFQTTGPAPTGWSAWPVRGSVVAVQDAIGHRTDIELDRYRLLPVNVTNTAGLTILALYNLRVLQPSAVTDANGNVTQIR